MELLFPPLVREYNLDGEALDTTRADEEDTKAQEDMAGAGNPATDVEAQLVSRTDGENAPLKEEASTRRNTVSTRQHPSSLARSQSSTIIRGPGISENVQEAHPDYAAHARKVNRRLFGLLRKDVRRRVEEENAAHHQGDLVRHGVSVRDFAPSGGDAAEDQGDDESRMPGSEGLVEGVEQRDGIDEEAVEAPEKP